VAGCGGLAAEGEASLHRRRACTGREPAPERRPGRKEGQARGWGSKHPREPPRRGSFLPTFTIQERKSCAGTLTFLLWGPKHLF